MDGLMVAAFAVDGALAAAVAVTALRQKRRRRRSAVQPVELVAPRRGLDAEQRAAILAMPSSRLEAYPVVQAAARIVMVEREALGQAWLPHQEERREE